jgi:hypothetical protein
MFLFISLVLVMLYVIRGDEIVYCCCASTKKREGGMREGKGGMRGKDRGEVEGKKAYLQHTQSTHFDQFHCQKRHKCLDRTDSMHNYRMFRILLGNLCSLFHHTLLKKSKLKI